MMLEATGSLWYLKLRGIYIFIWAPLSLYIGLRAPNKAELSPEWQKGKTVATLQTLQANIPWSLCSSS